jgi:hydroxymethylpyrimidine/phosphomethylpyrimidine kinase
MKGRVLIIAGSDSGGGAGIQADIKTVTALDGFAMTAITALTAQNTLGVHGIHEVPAEFVGEQIRVVLSDLGADCVKIGMLHRPEVIEAVAEILRAEAPDVPVVVDPVMVAKGGSPLLVAEAVETMKRRLLPLATVLTPNLPEAAALSGIEMRDADAVEKAGRVLATLGPRHVLLKGGHMVGGWVVDRLFAGEKLLDAFEAPRIETPHTHGTGCTVASAVAVGLAQGLSVPDAVVRALAYVREAIRTHPGYGKGHGPLNHAHTVRPFRA